jgi:hypothetical protein
MRVEEAMVNPCVQEIEISSHDDIIDAARF